MKLKIILLMAYGKRDRKQITISTIERAVNSAHSCIYIDSLPFFAHLLKQTKTQCSWPTPG